MFFLVPRPENHRMENFHLTLKDRKWLVLEREQVQEERARGHQWKTNYSPDTSPSALFFWGMEFQADPHAPSPLYPFQSPTPVPYFLPPLMLL